MQDGKRKNAFWNLQVPEQLDVAIDKLIATDFHLTKAEFIREAVREKLAKHGITHQPEPEKEGALGIKVEASKDG
jgi:Arc/MetJ-type ribon-helix-helix transcriptional regulator